MVSEVVISSLFEKRLSKLNLEDKLSPTKQILLSLPTLGEGEVDEEGEGTTKEKMGERSLATHSSSSSLLWCSSYGPKPSFDSESSFCSFASASSSTLKASSSTIENKDNDEEGTTKILWWQTNGTTVMLGWVIPLSVLSILLLLIPFGSPTDPNMLRHVPWLVIYAFSLPLLYSSFINEKILFHFKISHSKTFVRLYPLICGTLTFSTSILSGEFIGFPVKFSLCYFFGSVFFVSAILYGAMAIRARKQKKERKFNKIIMAIFSVGALFVGWTIATIVLKYFNTSGILVQSSIVSLLSIWKCICMEMLKIGSKMTKKTGERYELIMVAMSCCFVHWFWTLFTDIAFAAVESVWTFVIYLVIDSGTGLWFILQTSETFITADFSKWEPIPPNNKEPLDNNDTSFEQR